MLTASAAVGLHAAPRAEAVGAWGGYSNGQIPLSALTVISWATSRRLRSDAAAALSRLNSAYASRFDANIVVTDAYRDLATQTRLKAEKGNLAAKPGTSNHGWALAVDLGGGINSSYVTPQYLWMAEVAPGYGWINPAWAKPGPGYQKSEPWHWEYTGDGSQIASSGADPDPEPTKLEDDLMRILVHKDRGIWLVGPGYAHCFTAEEWSQFSQYNPGIPVTSFPDDAVGLRVFDLHKASYTQKTA
ncbi:MAG TPA: M15 family metallopeptidase [Cellulomonas sp.]